jgi:preprotein translocase subunit YajC
MQLVQLLLAQTEPTTKPQGGFGDPSFLIMMVLVFAAMWFILILPAKRKEKRDRDALFSNMKKNDEVVTASGIIGIVALIKDDEVVLKVDESSNTRLRVRKNSIVQILTPKDGPGKSGVDAKGSDNASAVSPPASN